MKAISTLTIVTLTTFLSVLISVAEENKQPVSVNLSNFVRAETDHMFRVNMKALNVKIGQISHTRKPTTPDNQPVIRLNSTMINDFVRETDGGITLYVQHDSPGKDKEPNWLPAPKGDFIVTKR